MEIKLFYCAYCEYKTKRKYDLNRHHNALHSKNTLKIINEKNNIHIEKNNIHIEDINNTDDYICKKCNKSYKTKKSFLNHEKNCTGINSLTCPKCMKTFSHVNNKNKHIKINNCKAKSIIHYNKQDNDNNNIIINNNIVINNNIINNYGSERKDYITFEDIMDILLKSGNNIVPKYIEFKHFNDNFPENKNIKY